MYKTSNPFAKFCLATSLGLAFWLAPATQTQAQATLDGGAILEILGTSTTSLLGNPENPLSTGGDLTDPENDGNESAGPEDLSWNWVSISSNNEPGFEGGEFSYNVFDNRLGPANDKWCCDDATEANPKNITVEFSDVVRLTHFTVSSANDTPTRDPQDWQIQGSNDGLEFTPIFIQIADTPIWDARLQVAKITLDQPSAPYKFIRFECTRTADTLYQVGEIEYFGEFGLGVPKIELLGTGTAALLGGDLTDPENDGDEAAYPGPTWNGVTFFGNNEAAFGGGEFAFNVFDNRVGGGSDKWCCDDPTEAAPLFVGASFPRAVSITHFTITSGNDTPNRDPRRWKLQGSNDNTTWEDIFVQDSDTPIWTARDQVAKITLPVASKAYQLIRYLVTDTADPLHQLNEIELFGRAGGASIPRLAGARAGRDSISLNVADGLDTALDTATVVIKIDDVVVVTTNSKNDTTTTFVYTSPTRYEPDSAHTFNITGKDNAGNPLSFSGTVKVPVPWFPDSNLSGPEPVEGLWALRYIFAAGTIDSIPSALAAIAAVGTEEFTGRFADVTTPVANYPAAGGFIPNGLPYDEAATAHPDGGWNGEDFIQLFIGNIVIPADGEYTFGVHSDDGFALRIRGGQAVAVSGNGQLDPGDPEAVVHPANTGDSNTRGTYSLKAGTYRIEFFWWERGGGDHGELYAAPGRWANDGDTDTWKLVGDPTPADTYIKLGVDNDGWSVVSSDPSAGDIAENAINNWAQGNADLDATAGQPVKTDIGSWGDPDTNAGIPAFPKNTPGVDDNDYAIRATAKLVVPQTGTYSLGFNSDDGAYMKVAGQVFTEITVNGTGTSAISEDGSTVTCDCLTGDSNTRATITLAQGTYDIEVGMFERGGGAFLTVRGAQVEAPSLPVLNKNGTGTFATAQALQLTATIGPARPSISVVRNANGSLTVTWEGELHVATSVNGPYTKLEGAVSPLTLAPNQAAQFARAVKP
jgi:hypothetical protein